jgi:hypothetical protein
MPVVFDEVIGTILPETSSLPADPAPGSPQSPPENLRDRQRRLEKRAARLRAT